jgi:hypothetical protein
MSIFPTTILLATDGSEEVQLASTTAVDLAEKTDAGPRRCSSNRPRG